MSVPDELTFSVLGRALHARGVPALHGWFNTYWHFPVHSPPLHAHKILIDAVDALPALCDASVHVSRIPGFELTWHQCGDIWQTHAGDVATRLTLTPAHTRITLEHGAAPVAMNAQRLAALYTALTEAVRASGLIPLHAAAIARDGKATLLLGPSGTGKTTTLLRAVNAGWAPVAEDLVWLDPTTLEIYGWDRGVRLWPATTHDLVAGVSEDAWDVAADGKLFIPWQRMPVTRVPSATLARIVLLERDDVGGVPATDSGAASPPGVAPPGITPLAPHDAVRILWEAAGVPLSDNARARVAACISTLVPRIATSRLRLSEADVAHAL